jgi:outer membrane protein insertion porin family
LSAPRQAYLLVLVALGVWGHSALPSAWAQAQRPDPSEAIAQQLKGFEGRVIQKVRIEGLKQVLLQYVMNQIRSGTGKNSKLDLRLLHKDNVRLTHLGRFALIRNQVQVLANKNIVLIFKVEEYPLLTDVQVVGNKLITDELILGYLTRDGKWTPGMAGLRKGEAIDPFFIQRGRDRILREYEKKGYFRTDVTYDVQLLRQSGILLFKIREGFLLTIREIRMRGNQIFADDTLFEQISSSRKKKLLGILEISKGSLERELLNQDAAKLRKYHQDRGYLDARVGVHIEVAPNQRDALVVFQIYEGPQYTVTSVEVQGNEIYDDETIRRAMVLRAGDIYQTNLIRQSRNQVRTLYGKLGFIAAKVLLTPNYVMGKAQVQVAITIEEGRWYRVGRVSVKGNEVTRQSVILREVRGIDPGRVFDGEGLDRTRLRLRQSSLFTDAKVTILGDLADEFRDVLIEVAEQERTTSINLGAGINSDAGLVGSFSLTERNFDIARLGNILALERPRGGGQSFSINLQPGDINSDYSIQFGEPSLFESSIFMSMAAFVRDREREDWQEDRMGGTLSVGHRFSDIWSAQVSVRVEDVTLEDIEPDAPVDVFDQEGTHLLTSAGIQISRDTRDSRRFPTEGTVLSGQIDRYGTLGGDFDFTKIVGSGSWYWPIAEDYSGRRSVLSLRIRSGYILDEGNAPVFERFYAGGHRLFRGFESRGVGPRGIRADTGTHGDDPVGGEFMFFAGLQYNFPIAGDTLRMVIFVDSGTVDNEVSLSKYRVAVGAGIRLNFFRQIAFELDLATAIEEEDFDETQTLSFTFSLPF